MSTKKKSSKRGRRKSKLDSKLYAVLSGKSHRVVGRSRKLSAARRKAAGLVKRGSKHVSIRRGSETFAIGAAKRTSRRRRSKRRTSRRSHRRASRRSGRRHSRRRVSRNGRRRSKRRVSKNGRRRSRRRVSKNGRRRSRRRHSRR